MKPASVTARAGKSLVRVLCVDDHAVLMEGLRAQFAIDGHIELVGALRSAEGLLEEAERLKPDVVLLDIEMPGPDAFEAADRLLHLHPQVRVAFLSAHVRDGYIAAAYACGACGYFAKSDDLTEIVAGVHEVASSAQGTFVMGTHVRERCLAGRDRFGEGARPARRGGPLPGTPLEALTPRELEVLRLIGRGMSRNEVAAQLCRSVKTVDGHQERMMRKLGIASRAELLRFAIHEGLAEA
ncbi:MAG: response regulator transcription factor [Phycisphaerales bacterium]